MCAQNQPPSTGLQSPVYIPYYLPDLPVPTEEQLRRGDELLVKILTVVINVPLTDPKAVLKSFGIENMTVTTIPAYSSVFPVDESGRRFDRSQLQKFGFDGFFYQPWIVNDSTKLTSSLDLGIDREPCISIESVNRLFDGFDLKGQNVIQRSVHPVPRQKPWNNIGILFFEPLKGPLGESARMGFDFDFQRCAKNIYIGYIFKEK